MLQELINAIVGGFTSNQNSAGLLTSNFYMKKYIFPLAKKKVLKALCDAKSKNLLHNFDLLLHNLSSNLDHIGHCLKDMNSLANIEINSFFEEFFLQAKLIKRSFIGKREFGDLNLEGLRFQSKNRLMLAVFSFVKNYLFKVLLKKNLFKDKEILKKLDENQKSNIILGKEDFYYKAIKLISLAAKVLELLNLSTEFGTFDEVYLDLKEQLLNFSLENIEEKFFDKKTGTFLLSQKYLGLLNNDVPMAKDENSNLLLKNNPKNKLQKKTSLEVDIFDNKDQENKKIPLWEYQIFREFHSQLIKLQNSILFLSKSGVVDQSPSISIKKSNIKHSRYVTGEFNRRVCYSNFYNILNLITKESSITKCKLLIKPVFSQITIVLRSVAYQDLDSRQLYPELNLPSHKELDYFINKIAKIVDRLYITLNKIGYEEEGSLSWSKYEAIQVIRESSHKSKEEIKKNLRKKSKRLSKKIIFLLEIISKKKMN